MTEIRLFVQHNTVISVESTVFERRPLDVVASPRDFHRFVPGNDNAPGKTSSWKPHAIRNNIIFCSPRVRRAHESMRAYSTEKPRDSRDRHFGVHVGRNSSSVWFDGTLPDHHEPHV